MAHVKETDYLYISTRIKVLEKNMLSREKLSRMAQAHSKGEALKILAENGFGEIAENDGKALDEALLRRRTEMLDLLYKYCPDTRVIDVFRLKYDYHNIKVFVKSAALGTDEKHLYSDAGTVNATRLCAALRDKKPEDVPQYLYDAAQTAAEILLKTHDPQLCDAYLDREHIMQMQKTAQDVKSAFLAEYVRKLTDISNLRVAVRSFLAEKDREYLKKAVCPGGSADMREIIDNNCRETIEKAFSSNDYKDVAAVGIDVMTGKVKASVFDKLCDEVLLRFLDSSKLIPFGEAQVVSYILKTENEITSVKSILTCKDIGMSENEIMERLRLYGI